MRARSVCEKHSCVFKTIENSYFSSHVNSYDATTHLNVYSFGLLCTQCVFKSRALKNA